MRPSAVSCVSAPPWTFGAGRTLVAPSAHKDRREPLFAQALARRHAVVRKRRRGAAGALGAEVKRRNAVAIDATAHGCSVRQEEGTLTADLLVVAAAAATPDLLAPLGLRLRLRTEPGLIVRKTAAAPTLRCILGSPEVHPWQATDGTVVAGSDYGGTQRFDERDVETRAILSRIGALAPAFGGVDAAKATVTGRPMLPDDRPAIGEIAPGLDVAVTHSGMTLAPLIAGALAVRSRGGEADPDLPCRADRSAVAGAPEAAQ